MNITIYNPHNRNQKYILRYRPSYDKVTEGTFTIEDESGKLCTVDEEFMYSGLDDIFENALYAEDLRKENEPLLP